MSLEYMSTPAGHNISQTKSGHVGATPYHDIKRPAQLGEKVPQDRRRPDSRMLIGSPGPHTLNKTQDTTAGINPVATHAEIAAAERWRYPAMRTRRPEELCLASVEAPRRVSRPLAHCHSDKRM